MVQYLRILICTFFFTLHLFNLQLHAQTFIQDEYEEISNTIILSAMSDRQGFERLSEFVDYYPHRLSGSEMLENSIDWIVEKMKEDRFDTVYTQPVMVPHWVRGREYASIEEPYKRNLPVLGLGNSVATPDSGITADVIAVRSFEELAQKTDEISGKIVLYNVPFTTYGETVQYRTRGAVLASRAGAVASLVRSVTPFSMQTLHTGTSALQDTTEAIPHASITLEDANFIQRMQDRGDTVRVHLYMEAEILPDKQSRNVIAEIRGSEHPNEIITIGGHIDSWDVGQGVMDDAGGSFVSWEAARLLLNLGVKPKRTIRVVFWTNEENGLNGARKYHEKAVDEGIENHVLAIESDGGIFKPIGFGFTGSEQAFQILKQIGNLLDQIESGEVIKGGGGADISPLMQEGVPGMGLLTDRSKYFWYHHTNADVIDIIDREEFRMNVATMAVFAYIVADLDQKLPRR